MLLYIFVSTVRNLLFKFQLRLCRNAGLGLNVITESRFLTQKKNSLAGNKPFFKHIHSHKVL